MTTPHDMPGTGPARGPGQDRIETTHPATPSLSRLLETWRAWSTSAVFTRAEQRARAAGDNEHAAQLRDLIAGDREVAALDALAAQHEVSSLLAGWDWHTVRAAREQGATWADIAQATRTEPAQARAAYLEQIDRQEHTAARYPGLPFADAEDYRAAAGHRYDQLHPDTPAHVVEQIEGAIAREDLDELDALRGVWWNPHHTPAVAVTDDVVTIFDESTRYDPAVLAQAQAAAERGDLAEARRLYGIDDAALAALVEAQKAAPLHVQIAPDVFVLAGDRQDGYRNHTIDEAVTALAPLMGPQAATRAVAGYLAEHGPRVGPAHTGAVLEDEDLVAIAYPAGVDPWATAAGDTGRVRADGGAMDRVPHTHVAVTHRGYTESGHRVDGDPGRDEPGWWAQAPSSDCAQPAITFDQSGHDFNHRTASTCAAADRATAELAARHDATDLTRQLHEPPWIAQGATVDTAHIVVADAGSAWPVMPGWMCAHTARTEAEIAADTAAPLRPDDPAELAARIAALRNRVAGHDDGGYARGEQLTRWHYDDLTADQDATSGAAQADDTPGRVDDEPGWSP